MNCLLPAIDSTVSSSSSRHLLIFIWICFWFSICQTQLKYQHLVRRQCCLSSSSLSTANTQSLYSRIIELLALDLKGWSQELNIQSKALQTITGGGDWICCWSNDRDCVLITWPSSSHLHCPGASLVGSQSLLCLAILTNHPGYAAKLMGWTPERKNRRVQ